MTHTTLSEKITENATTRPSIWIEALVAFASAVALISQTNSYTIALAVFFLGSQVTLYTMLARVVEKETSIAKTNAYHRLLSNTVLQTVLFLLGTGAADMYVRNNVPTLRLIAVPAILKAIRWSLLFYVVSLHSCIGSIVAKPLQTEKAPWDIAATVTTFGVASTSVSALSVSAMRASSRAAAAITAQAQTIFFLPNGLKGRFWLFIFMVYPLVLLLQTNVTVHGFLEGFSGSTLERHYSRSQHPIDLLIQKSSAEFSEMLSGQSKTLDEAIGEYQKRYHRTPPKGFDKWFKYAKANHAQIIDEYDMINEALAPFWKVKPSTIRRYIDEVADSEDDSLWKFRIVNDSFDMAKDDYMSNQLKAMLHEVIHDLPEISIIVNSLDEPRVILPSWAAEQDDRQVEFHDLGRTATWEAITGNCTPHSRWSSLARSVRHQKVDTYGLSFIKDIRESKDVCRHPEYENMHGLFIAPDTFKYTTQLVPMLSQSAPSTFGDILYPSPYYLDMYDDGVYQDDNDPSWEQKKSTLYWAGSTTGSHGSNASTWQHNHRQRFVTLANGLLNNTSTFLTETKPGVWKTFKSREIFRELYDAKFTNIVQCEEEECATQDSFFHVGEHEDASTAYRSRFIFDLDGNSFSGRFYNLLGSRSVVLKQTVLREWHDERLFPWVHYVPVSLQMDELPEIMRYLALTEQGSKRAREIADVGREWKEKALRKQDASVFLYRLILEYARVLDDERDETRL